MTPYFGMERQSCHFVLMVVLGMMSRHLWFGLGRLAGLPCPILGMDCSLILGLFWILSIFVESPVNSLLQ